jgi:UDP-N-acetylmuramate: L-alanyl-gamma-D-glutamyl-meso-diaminopimelate ligase
MIAICGTGMAALAGLLSAAGHRVSGSDAQVFPPMSTLLQNADIHCNNGYDPRHIGPDTDLVIIGNAVRADNPEVVAALARNLPYCSMPQALNRFFLKTRRPAVVVGTHGKTTTSSLLAWTLMFAGYDPGMMIGGWVNNFNGNHRLGSAPYFVIEGDEYDTAFFDKGPKFLHYNPSYAILTSIEHDHADIYADLPEIQAAFDKFVRLLPSEGYLAAAAGSLAVSEVLRHAACRYESYGVDIPADWQARGLKQVGERLAFEVVHHGETLGVVESPLVGRHNVNNALGVIAVAHQIGTPWETIRKAIFAFQGVKRRQEVVASVRDILIIDDFAHHPTAITETLAALRLRYPGRRLFVVFEPRSMSSRRNLFQQSFVDAFEGADVTFLAAIFAPEKVPEALRLDPAKVVSDLVARGRYAEYVPSADQIVQRLAEQLAPGDMVCIMSSGGFDAIYQKLSAALWTGLRHGIC